MQGKTDYNKMFEGLQKMKADELIGEIKKPNLAIKNQLSLQAKINSIMFREIAKLHATLMVHIMQHEKELKNDNQASNNEAKSTNS